MEAAVEKNLKEEAFRLELVTKKLNTCNVFQVTSVSFIFLSTEYILCPTRDHAGFPHVD